MASLNICESFCVYIHTELFGTDLSVSIQQKDADTPVTSEPIKTFQDKM